MIERRFIWLFVLASASLIAIGCLAESGTPDIAVTYADIPIDPIDFPVGESNVIWLADSQLLIRPDVLEKRFGYQDTPLVYLLLRDGVFYQRHFPPDPLCWRYQYYESGVLPDGRLGLVKRCDFQPDEPHQAPRDGPTTINAYDWESGVMEQLVAKSIPPIGADHFSWNPEMTRGVQEAGSLLGTIYWLTPEGAEPMEIAIEEGLRRWSLADNFSMMIERSGEVRDVGIAGNASWSPDGKQVAFFASLDALGRSGPSRLTGEYRLYLLSIDTLQAIPVLDSIYFPHRLAWSPNGEWLTFIGQRKNACNEGACLWLFSPSRNKLIRATGDAIRDFSWSPDGGKVVATRKCAGCPSSGGTIRTETGDVLEVQPCRPTSCVEIGVYDLKTIMTP